MPPASGARIFIVEDEAVVAMDLRERRFLGEMLPLEISRAYREGQALSPDRRMRGCGQPWKSGAGAVVDVVTRPDVPLRVAGTGE